MLRSSTGHYTATTYGGNGKWETYDDTKSSIQHTKHAYDVEFVVCTIRLLLFFIFVLYFQVIL